MAASAGDAHPYPIYNARYRVTFPILDADGDLVTGAASLDSELSQDQGTFADATNEATEIATSSGMYYLDLIATELDTKQTAIIVKTGTAGAKTTPIVLYPARLPVIRTGTAQAGAASTITLDSSASAKDDAYNGCYVNITNDSPAGARGQARRITDYVGSTKVATIEGTWGTNPSSASTFEILLTPEACGVAAWQGTHPVDANTVGVPRVDLDLIEGSNVSATSAQLGVNVVNWNNSAVATPTVAGVPEVDVTHWIGTAAATPTVAGVPEVDVTHFNGTAGTFSSGRPEVNTSHVAGTAQTAGDIIADTNDIQARLPAALVGGRMDSSVGAYASGMTPTRPSASGTADSGSTTTIVDTERTEADTDYWKGCLVKFTSGTLNGQTRLVTAFDAGTDTITFAPATTVAVGTHTYELYPMSRVDLHLWAGAVANALISGRVDANAQVVGDKTGYSVSTVSAGAITSGSFGAGAIDAAAIATGAIDADAIADNAIDAGAIAADAITAAKIANGAIDAATFAAGAIDATAIATGAITAAKFAASAIDAAALATDAVNEIRDAIRDLAMVEPAAVPAVTGTLREVLSWLLVLSRNKITQTATTQTLRNDADSATIGASTLSDDGTTFTRGEFA